MIFMENKIPVICRVPSDSGSWLEMGLWLDTHMPNPPLDEPQRWSIIGTDTLARRIEFADQHDATLFALRWPG